ncbi:hypothetical protein NM688_g8409 [Phlebia brevispora]|uniref:Uncharacterized protein n=1 Tax=Phlebia brevispora TaxID=194682 RepID=A0ACC1RSC8_9APHY|nr:hypothetical protein NM688_g8409 [Phlebia brevispora]
MITEYPPLTNRMEPGDDVCDGTYRASQHLISRDVHCAEVPLMDVSLNSLGPPCEVDIPTSGIPVIASDGHGGPGIPAQDEMFRDRGHVDPVAGSRLVAYGSHEQPACGSTEHVDSVLGLYEQKSGSKQQAIKYPSVDAVDQGGHKDEVSDSLPSASTACSIWHQHSSRPCEDQLRGSESLCPSLRHALNLHLVPTLFNRGLGDGHLSMPPKDTTRCRESPEASTMDSSNLYPRQTPVEALCTEVEGLRVADRVGGVYALGTSQQSDMHGRRYTEEQRDQALLLGGVLQRPDLHAGGAPAFIPLPMQQSSYGGIFSYPVSSSPTAYDNITAHYYTPHQAAGTFFPYSTSSGTCSPALHRGVYSVDGIHPPAFSWEENLISKSHASHSSSRGNGPALRSDASPKYGVERGLPDHRVTHSATYPSRFEPFTSPSSEGRPELPDISPNPFLGDPQPGEVLTDSFSVQLQALEERLNRKVDDIMGRVEASMLDLIPRIVDARQMARERKGYATEDESVDCEDDERKVQRVSKPRAVTKRRSSRPGRPLQNTIHKKIRDGLVRSLGLHDDLDPVRTATSQEVREFEDGISPGPSMENFHLDYDSPATSSYNQAAFHAFGEEFAELVSQGVFPNIPLLEYMNGEYFASLAQSKFRFVRDKYRAVTQG